MLGHADNPPLAADQLLRWYIEAGADEAIGEQAIDRYAPPIAIAVAPAAGSPPPPPTVRAASSASAIPGTSAHRALACLTLADLRAAMETYDGCGLRRTCQRTVFADGNPSAPLMVIGEAPGADEDEQGLPFVGASGHLLDRMLASIGLDRQTVYITNVIPWRPPGNRKPEPSEVELCLPFIQRHIELVGPRYLILLGGAAASALLARPEPISRLRGRWMDYAGPRLPRPIPTMPTYHPAYLLRTPLQKRAVWQDFLAVRKRLDEAR